MLQVVEHLQKTCPTLKRDPLAQFVIILICMVHDVDNPGVTNEQLMKEDTEMADYFSNTGLTRKFLLLHYPPLCLQDEVGSKHSIVEPDN